MFDATKPLFFSGGDNDAISNDTSGSVAMKSIQAEY
jgi:hypothetical protein